MGYNRENYYIRIIEIQELAKKYQDLGFKNIHIYEDHVKNRYFICKRTFDEYLGIPARRELGKMRANEPAKQVAQSKHILRQPSSSRRKPLKRNSNDR